MAAPTSGILIGAITARVLAVEYPSAILAAGDGSGCAVTFRSPGRHATRLYRSDGTLVHTVPGVGAIAWHGGGFVTNTTGSLERWSLDAAEPERLGSWPGRRVTAAASGGLWLAGGTVLWRHDAAGEEQLELPLDRSLLGDATLSPAGDVVAVRLVEDGGSASSLRLYSRDGAELLRWHEPDWCVLAAAFADRGRAVVTRMRRDSKARQVALLDVATGERTTLVYERSDRGFVRLPAATATGNDVAYLRYVDGWPLLCVLNLDKGAERVLNPGPHEDLTDVDDAPAFSPNGRYLAFNSSAADLRERHLYTYDLLERKLERRSFAAGATGARAWLTDEKLLFVESRERDGAGLRWLDLAADAPAEPAATPAGSRRGVSPRPVLLEGPDGAVPADLYLPPDLDPSVRRPALVYAHGGVFRQLTRGYPASYAYTLLHELNLGLLELGFVVLSVEYRGSMGFGLAHDQANFMACGEADTADCALAARYLASLPNVDAERIGTWGLSWGGTMALQALVKHPELFAAGVNLAGIWDFEQRAGYWNALQAGQPIYFDGRMGPPGSDARRRASARLWAEGLRAPLLSIHGTADEAVDYQQQTLLQLDAERLGKRVTTVTLEGESHVFSSAEAWRLVVPRVIGFLTEHLGRPARRDG